MIRASTSSMRASRSARCGVAFPRQAAQRPVDRAVAQAHRHADVGADPARVVRVRGAGRGGDVGDDGPDRPGEHPGAQRALAADPRVGRDAAERRGVAVERGEAELLGVRLGEIGELHAEQLAGRGERVGDRRVARDAGQRLELAGRGGGGGEHALDHGAPGSSAPAREAEVRPVERDLSAVPAAPRCRLASRRDADRAARRHPQGPRGRRHRRRPRRRDRPGPRPRRAGREGRRASVRDLGRALADGDRVEIVTDRSPESLELVRHDTAHVLAAAVLDLYPGTKISIGPPIEDGFYYDFDFPDGVSVSEHDLPALEEKMREHVKAKDAFTREDVTVAQARERFADEAPALQGRADRRPRRGRRRDRLALHQRPVHRPLPRPARAGHRADQGLQAALARRRVLARRREPPDAHPHLRHRVPLGQGPRRAPRAARAGPGPRPPQARQGAQPVPLLRAVARQPLLAAGRDDRAERAHASCGARRTRPAATARSRRRSSTTPSSSGRPATGTCTGRTCTSPRWRGRAWASSP